MTMKKVSFASGRHPSSSSGVSWRLMASASVPLALLLGCGGDAATPAKDSARPAASATGAGPQPAQGGGMIGKTDLTWSAPTSFKLVPSPNAMRLATYQIARAEGDAEDPELTISQAMGTVDKNVERWEGQFGGNKAQRSELSVANLKVTQVFITGPYQGMGGVAKSDFAMLAAIVEWAGHDTHFFKLTGPLKSVEQARPAFDELIQSLGHK